MRLQKNIQFILNDHLTIVKQIEGNIPKIQLAAHRITDALQNKGKLLIAGNGGSAADAQHFAAELIGRFQLERHSLPAIALTTDTSILTSVANDYGFSKIFSRQIEGLANEKDLFIAISTSGNSKNLVEAVEYCRTKSYPTIALLGRDGGSLGKIAELPIIIKSQSTARIQETHITIIHILCELAESILFENKNRTKRDKRDI